MPILTEILPNSSGDSVSVASPISEAAICTTAEPNASDHCGLATGVEIGIVVK
jgi:hypothetical protein